MRCRVPFPGSQQTDCKRDEKEMVKALVDFGDNNWKHGLHCPWFSQCEDYLSTVILEALDCVLLINLLIFLTETQKDFYLK